MLMGPAMLTRTLALALAALALSACDIDAQPGEHNDDQVRESSDEPREPGDPEQPVPEDSGSPAEAGEVGGDEGGEGCGGEPEPIDPEAEPYPHSPGVSVGGAVVDCDVESGAEVVTWQRESTPELALYVAAIHDARSDAASDAAGEADIHFDRPGASVLALTAFDATHWNVTVGEHSGLTRVILIGYGEQTASVPEGVALETWHESHSACGYTLPFDGEGGCNTDLLLASLEAHVGAPLFRFDGCRSASTFDYAR